MGIGNRRQVWVFMENRRLEDHAGETMDARIQV
jgi:hypothetical protein